LVAEAQVQTRGSLPAAAEQRAQGDAPRSVVVLCRHPGGAPLSAGVGRLAEVQARTSARGADDGRRMLSTSEYLVGSSGLLPPRPTGIAGWAAAVDDMLLYGRAILPHGYPATLAG
jgi:hypothetical protein